MDKLFELLYVINQDANRTQRILAEKTGLSLGKTNNLIKKAIESGYLLSHDIEKKGKLRLTEYGLAKLEEQMNNRYATKIKVINNDIKALSTAVILAAGKREDFDVPVALLEIEEETLIERTIRILLDNAIEKIIIVVGYKKDNFEYISKKYPQVMLVENEFYKQTGTMKSLSLVAPYVTDDFLLLEGDIIFEKRAIKKLINHGSPNCMILTNESGSGDEAFVEFRNGSVYAISKDKHQLNRIDGEMIGLSKISGRIFGKMLELYQENTNSFLNYEYLLLDIGRTYQIGYEKIGDLVWWEFDTKFHYNLFKKNIHRRLKKYEKEWQFSEVKNIIAHALELDEERISSIDFVGGMTNSSYRIVIDEKNYIARVPGAGTEQMIDRIAEKRNCLIANQIGLDAEILYMNAETGIKVAEFIEDSEPLTKAMTRRDDVIIEVTKLLKRLHLSGLKFENEFDVFGEIEKYESLVKEVNGVFYDGYSEMKTRVIALKEVLDSLGREDVPCHNDCIAENFLRDETGRFYLIDWEYAGNNDPMWDLASYSIENEFTSDEDELLLKRYFSSNVIEEKSIIKLLLFKICQDFLWSTWTCVKEAKGVDFGTYGISRFLRAQENLIQFEKNYYKKRS